MAPGVAAAIVAALATTASASACANAGPMLEMVVDISPACFDICPELCKPLDDIITDYMMFGSKDRLQEKICTAREHFDCGFHDPSVLAKCVPVLSMGGAIGARLPMSVDEWEDLKHQCPTAAPESTPAPPRGSVSPAPGASSSAPDTTSATTGAPATTTTLAATTSTPEATTTDQATTSTAAVVTLAPTPAVTTAPPASTQQSAVTPQADTSTATTAACTGSNEMLQMVISLYPQCFQRCSQLCGAMESLLAKFEGNPDEDAIEKQVCASSAQFSCAFQPSNTDACQPVLAAGARFNVPQSGSQLSRRCSRRSADVAHDKRAENEDEPDLSAATRWAGISSMLFMIAGAVVFAI